MYSNQIENAHHDCVVTVMTPKLNPVNIVCNDYESHLTV